jgi:hypothetical protein
VGTIAQQLGVHHATVDRGLSQAGLPKAEGNVRTSRQIPDHMTEHGQEPHVSTPP